jgi:hypothetical protein
MVKTIWNTQIHSVASMQSFRMFKHVVHILTTVLWRINVILANETQITEKKVYVFFTLESDMAPCYCCMPIHSKILLVALCVQLS